MAHLQGEGDSGAIVILVVWFEWIVAIICFRSICFEWFKTYDIYYIIVEKRWDVTIMTYDGRNMNLNLESPLLPGAMVPGPNIVPSLARSSLANGGTIYVDV